MNIFTWFYSSTHFYICFKAEYTFNILHLSQLLHFTDISDVGTIPWFISTSDRRKGKTEQISHKWSYNCNMSQTYDRSHILNDFTFSLTSTAAKLTYTSEMSNDYKLSLVRKDILYFTYCVIYEIFTSYQRCYKNGTSSFLV